MVRSYRSRWEILMEILQAALNGAKKTHIIYRVNLNHLRFNKYFPGLLAEGLIAKDTNCNGDTLYRTTEKGKALLRTLLIVKNSVPDRESSSVT